MNTAMKMFTDPELVDVWRHYIDSLSEAKVEVILIPNLRDELSNLLRANKENINVLINDLKSYS